MRSLRRLLVPALAALAATPAAAQRTAEIPPLHVVERPEPGTVPRADTLGLRFRVSDAPEGGRARTAPAPATMLAVADAARVLARLPALAPAAAADSFAFPARTLPPPRAGRVVQAAFPPADSLRPPPDAGRRTPMPLAVVRGAPAGEVTVGAEVTVAFSQPMVPLSSIGEIAGVAVPVRLSPEAPGRWRWLDVRTLVFTPEGRLPAATEFTVTVPAGARSAAGTSTLAEPVEWTFRTAPPIATGAHPQGTVAREPLLLLRFDQRVDAAALLRHLRVEAGGRAVAVHLATEAEVRADPTARALAREAAAGTWVALRPAAPLPYDAEVTATIAPGSFSAEGPLPTAVPQSWSFRTYGPLRVREARCGYRPEDCRPGTPFAVSFTNPLDEDAFRPEWIRVEPAIEGMRVEARGPMLVVAGRTRPRTRYTVRIDPAVRDVHGQTLGTRETRAFEVGTPYPELGALGDRMIVLDPAGPRRLSVTSHDHPRLRVRVHRVEPSDWPGFHPRRPGRGAFAALPGRAVVDRVVAVEGAPGETRETPIDLDEALQGRPGQLVVAVEGMDGEGREQGTYAWVQATRIGLAAFADAGEVTAWATSLVDGTPVAGARVELGGLPAALRAPSASTDGDGTATLPLPRAADAGYLVATLGDDRALLPGGWSARPADATLLWYSVTDRHLYRPGEEVRFKGWVRRFERSPSGGVGAVEGARVAWTVRDPRGADLASGTAELGRLGGFDGVFRVPEGANLGMGQVELRLVGAEGPEQPGHLAFAVQEFRRPEFEVAAEVDPGPHVVGGSAEASVQASYFAGGGLPGAPVTWRARSSPAWFTPPGWASWRFGMQDGGWWAPRAHAPGFERVHEGETDAAGHHAVRLDFDAALPPRAHTLRAEATVVDVNRQSWTTASSLLVHPAEVYVGVRTERGWIAAGERIELSLVVVDLEGRVVPGLPVEVSAVRLEWRSGPGGWEQAATDSLACAAVSGETPAACAFPTHLDGGAYRITARVRDAAGRPSHTQLTLWAAGSSPWRMGPGHDRNQARQVTLVPDREEYAPGDTARVLAQLPFWPARGVVTVRREGVVRTEALASDGPTATFSVPIGEADVPNVWVQVDLVGATDSAGRPHPTARATDFASGAARLAVPPVTRTLEVRAVAADSVSGPDAETWVMVSVRDPEGRPMPDAEVALAVVDESVLALTGYRFRNPVELFYPQWNAGVSDSHLRSHLRVPRDTTTLVDVLSGRVSGVQLEGLVVTGERVDIRIRGASSLPAPPAAPPPPPGAPAAPADGAPIALRTNFDALALWAPAVRTGPDGTARVPLTLPSSLTRYRVMAAAVSGPTFFGAGESTLTVRQELMVRPSAPRFLNYGDRFELPVVVQNGGAQPLEVSVAARGDGIVFTEPGKRVTVPAGDRVEVRLAAEAVRAGTARVQVAAAAGGLADAAEIALPVYTPATVEAFATYGSFTEDGAVELPLHVPGDAIPAFGGLEVTTSSTALQELTDAFLYLVSYRFECSEQVASRLLAVAALRDVLAEFRAEGLPPPDALADSVRRDLRLLEAAQTRDGGFAFWRADDESWPYVSVHALHALVRIRERGYEVPEPTYRRAMEYAREVDLRIPSGYPASARLAVRAYAAYVRDLAGDPGVDGELRGIFREGRIERLPLEVAGWLLAAVAGRDAFAAERDALLRLVNGRATETASTATFATRYEEGEYLLLHSDRRTDAVVLEALLRADPRSELATKTVRGLLGHRTRGRWSNTQENAWVLLALDRYFRIYEERTPEFVAGLWLGGRFAGEHRFTGRTAERHHLEVPMRLLAERAPGSVTIGKEGPGRLYYRAGLRYAPRDLELAPLDRGFAVERSYEGVDDPGDVTRGEDGTWRVRAGARVRVTVTMAAPSRRLHVALVDPLPAGFEPVNPALRGAEPGARPTSTRGGDGARRWWWGPWFQHQNLRDDRAEAFTSLLPAGVYTYAYVARATTPGLFLVPPPRAEEMYSPETFGRGATARVEVVEAR